jgi:hypothetical protein
MPLVGHTTPLLFQAAELARRGDARRVVLTTPAFIKSPHAEVSHLIHTASEANAAARYGVPGVELEFIEAGFVNLTSRNLAGGTVSASGDLPVRPSAIHTALISSITCSSASFC